MMCENLKLGMTAFVVGDTKVHFEKRHGDVQNTMNQFKFLLSVMPSKVKRTACSTGRPDSRCQPKAVPDAFCNNLELRKTLLKQPLKELD